MRLESLECLLAVADTGSMNRAARILYCTQPTVSATIKALEKELDVQLLERREKGVSLTDAGEKVVADARTILGLTASWRALAVSSACIKLSYSTNVLNPLLMDAIARFKAKCPHAGVTLYTEHLPSQLPGFSACRLGIVTRAMDVRAAYEDLLEYARSFKKQVKLLCSDHFAAYVGAGDPLAGKERITLSELAGHRLCLGNTPERFPYYARFRSIGCDCESSFGELSNDLIAAAKGFAVLILPTMIAMDNPFLRDGSLRQLEIVDSHMPHNYFFLYPSSGMLHEEQLLAREIIDVFGAAD